MSEQIRCTCVGMRFDGCDIHHVNPPAPIASDQLNHPCKETCSGWKQGYEEGVRVATQSERMLAYESDAVAEAVRLERERCAEIVRKRYDSENELEAILNPSEEGK